MLQTSKQTGHLPIPSFTRTDPPVTLTAADGYANTGSYVIEAMGCCRVSPIVNVDTSQNGGGDWCESIST